MNCACEIYSATANLLRKVHKPRRFNRQHAAQPLTKQTAAYWTGGLDALFEYLADSDRWNDIQRHCRVNQVAASVQKSMSDDDKRFLVALLAKFDYYDDVEAAAAAIVEATRFETFEAAATFALQRLGIRSADFTLKNERIRDMILARASADVHAARNNLDGILQTIVRNFYDLGSNPYDSKFIAELRSSLGDVTAWEARRFALTETGIAAELAQVETYRRNGVTRKRWNILGRNTRESHQALDQVEADIDGKFDVGGYAADHPLDPSLPAGELVNCHCWLTPVVSDDFQIDPSKVWEGQ